MPIYDFRCSSCGEVFEAVVSAGEDVVCGRCGGDVERLLSAPGRVGVSTPGGGLQCGRETTCCGAKEPCGKSDCHK